MSILVYTENWDGKFKKLTAELVSYAASIAGMGGGEVTALSIGNVNQDELSTLGNFGASRVLSVEHAPPGLDNQLYANIIAAAVEKSGASIVVMSNNNTGKGVAPRLSVKLKSGLASGVTDLPVSTDPVVVPKKVFSGKAFGRVRIVTPVAILTLSQNSFEVRETGGTVQVESFDPGIDLQTGKTKINNVHKQEGKLLLSDAEVVVSGGRGMKSPDNWGPIEELAEVLGAATACSRPVSDEGWRPHEEHTGQTGKIIAPNLYMAFGISGAIQHLAGVSSSKCIVAVNMDKDAPIFEAADYGIVGDALKVLPQLIEEIRSVRSR
jgi:electron transfer flavoprotein alpha subunit